MRRRALLRGFGASALIVAGCVGQDGPSEGEGTPTSQEDITSDLDPEQVDAVCGRLTDEIPDGVSAIPYDHEEIAEVNAIQGLIQDAIKKTYGGNRICVSRNYDTEQLWDAVEALNKFRRYEGKSGSEYPDGWYIKHPDQIFAVQLSVFE